METQEQEILKELKARARRFRDLFGSELGQIVLEDMRAQFGYGGASLDPAILTAPLDGISKAMISQRNDGQRDVLLYIEQQMAARFTTNNTEESEEE